MDGLHVKAFKYEYEFMVVYIQYPYPTTLNENILNLFSKGSKVV